MTTPNNQISSDLTIVLKTKLFNDEDIVSNALQIKTTSDTNNKTNIVDISNEFNGTFTDTDWDRILNSILTSSKVITV